MKLYVYRDLEADVYLLSLKIFLYKMQPTEGASTLHDHQEQLNIYAL